MIAVRPDRAAESQLATAVLGGALVSRHDLVGVNGARPGSGRSDGEFWECERWFVKTRATRCFGDLASAVVALDRLYDVKCRLGELAPAGTLVAIASERDTYQLWTIAPKLVTLREDLDRASQRAAWDELKRVVATFAFALGESWTASVEGGMCLDPNPANFATQGARIRYIDDDVGTSRDVLGIEDAFVARFSEYPAAPASVWDHYVVRVARELASRSTVAIRAQLGLGRRLRAAATLRPGTASFVEKLLEEIETR